MDIEFYILRKSVGGERNISFIAGQLCVEFITLGVTYLNVFTLVCIKMIPLSLDQDSAYLVYPSPKNTGLALTSNIELKW